MEPHLSSNLEAKLNKLGTLDRFKSDYNAIYSRNHDPPKDRLYANALVDFLELAYKLEKEKKTARTSDVKKRVVREHKEKVIQLQKSHKEEKSNIKKRHEQEKKKVVKKKKDDKKKPKKKTVKKKIEK